MAVGKEQKVVKTVTDGVSDIRWDSHLFGRMAASQPDLIVTRQANSYLSFFEMLACRYEAGDVTPEMLPLLRLSKKIVTFWAEETQNN